MLASGSFTTELKPCPYLHDRPSSLEVFAIAEATPEEHDLILAAGVRHFGRSYFRPACPTCRQCISLRVPVESFSPSKSQRRVVAKNRDLVLEIGEPTLDDERLALYRRFHAEREAKRGWTASHMDADEYYQSFVDSPVPALEFRYRFEGRLVAVAYVDETPLALNSVFGFWEPSCSRRSLGTFDVLCELAEARARGKRHLYLGYFVGGCPSLEYKRCFRPFEALLNGAWHPVEG